jgi:DNA-binding MltR family transcriptional regulator
MSFTEEKAKLVATALVKESDRGCVILGAALMDEALEELLRSVCRQTPSDIKANVDPLFQGYAPLATFSARIQVAFALGILPRGLRDKIEIIRRLRNDFAHEWGPIDFDDPRFASRLQVLIIRSTVEERDNDWLGPLGPRKDQLISRLALIFRIQSMIETIAQLTELARDGVDIRAVVKVWEKEGVWVE